MDMPNTTPRPQHIEEIEAASRHRTQDAFAILKRKLEDIPRDDLRHLLAIAYPSATLGRRGLTNAQAIKIAAVIVE